MQTFSPDYQPLPSDWRPPDWLPPEPKLQLMDEAVTKRISAAAQGKIFNPPDRLPTTWERVTKPLKAITPALVGGLAALGVFSIPVILSLYKNGWKPTQDPFGGGFWPVYIASAVGLLVFKTLKQKIEEVLHQPKPLPPLTKKDIEFLLQEARKNPLFEQMWEVVSARCPIEIEIVDKSKFPSEAVFANYSSSTDDTYFVKEKKIVKLTRVITKHTINIQEDIPLKKAFSALVFELGNAFQTDRFAFPPNWAHAGLINRNEYAILTEYVESATDSLAYQVLSYGIQHLNWHKDLDLWGSHLVDIGNKTGVHPFVVAWLNDNLRPSPQAMSHAEFYRKQWDEKYSKAYFQRNQPTAAAASG